MTIKNSLLLLACAVWLFGNYGAYRYVKTHQIYPPKHLEPPGCYLATLTDGPGLVCNSPVGPVVAGIFRLTWVERVKLATELNTEGINLLGNCLRVEPEVWKAQHCDARRVAWLKRSRRLM